MSTEGMGGGFKVTPKVKGTLRPISNRVIVSNMHFGEQKTASGLILTSDDGDSRGIYPRWGQVHAKGPANDDSYDDLFGDTNVLKESLELYLNGSVGSDTETPTYEWK